MGLFIEDDYPEELLGHHDLCNAPAGGGCECFTLERRDEERQRDAECEDQDDEEES